MLGIRYVQLEDKEFGIVLINICRNKSLTTKLLIKEDMFY